MATNLRSNCSDSPRLSLPAHHHYISPTTTTIASITNTTTATTATTTTTTTMPNTEEQVDSFTLSFTAGFVGSAIAGGVQEASKRLSIQATHVLEGGEQHQFRKPSESEGSEIDLSDANLRALEENMNNAIAEERQHGATTNTSSGKSKGKTGAPAKKKERSSKVCTIL